VTLETLEGKLAAKQPGLPALPSAQSKPRMNVGGMQVVGPSGERIVEVEVAGVVMSPREEHLTRQMVCLLVANGESIVSVAGKLGLTESCVEATVMSQRGLEMIVRFQHDIAPDPFVRVKKMASIALDVQTRLLLGPASDTVKAKVANEVLDRAHGKATQVIETHSMHFDLKDAMQVEKAIAASSEKLRRIEEMQKKLTVPVGRADNPMLAASAALTSVSPVESPAKSPMKSANDIRDS
jgi:hypothetical protein